MADPFAQFGGSQLPEEQKKPSGQDPFAAFGGQAHPTPPEQSDPFQQFGGEQHSPDAIQKEIETRSAFDKPILLPEQITDAEINQIAQKHKVDPAELRSALPFLGGRPEQVGVSDVAKGAAGLASEAALGVPQKLYKLAQTPNKERALDELQELAAGRKSYLQKGLELAVPVAGVGGVALKEASAGAKAMKTALTGAAVGGLGGFAGSRQGEELHSAAVGAPLGAAVGLAGEGAIRYLTSKANRAEQKLLSNPKYAVDLDKISDQAMSARQESEQILDNAILKERSPILSPDDAEQVAREQLSPDVLEQVLDPSTVEGQAARKGLTQSDLDTYGDRAVLVNRGSQIAEERYVQFSKKITGDNSLRTADEARLPLEDIYKRQGEDFIAKQYDEFARTKAIEDFQKNLETRVINSDRMGRLGEIGLKASDAQFALRQIDQKFNTEAEKYLTDLSTNRNKMTFVKGAFRKDLQEIGDQAQRAGITQDLQNGGRVYRAMSTGNLDSLAPAEKEVATKIRAQYDKLLQFANDKAREDGITTMGIPKLQNFIHNVILPRAEIQVRVAQEMDKAAELASQKFGRQISDISELSPTEFRTIQQSEPVRNLELFLNMGKESTSVRSGAELLAGVQDRLGSRDGVVTLEKLARGSMERTGNIPEFIREKDMFRILDRYSHDLLSNLYQREPLLRLGGIAKRLEKVGANPESEYIEKLIQDAQGIRPGTPAAWGNDIRRQLSTALDKKIQTAVESGDQSTAKALRTVKEMGDLPYWISKQIYSNVLGWNPHAILQNAASGFARTAPELGNKYGYQTYLRGLAYGIANWRQLSKHIKSSGLVPEEFNRNGERWLLQGLASSGPIHMSKQALESVGKLGMALYQASENLNRVSIVGTARMMASDLAKGSKLAQQSLSNFPAWVQRDVRKAGGDQVRTGQILSSYLNATTAFNYNRPSLYEYGRTMGPLFATFAKWPTAILGEALADLRGKGMTAGTSRIAQRLGTPLVALAAMDQLLSRAGLSPEESDRTKATLGAGGLKRAAPGTSLGQIASGGIFTPPVIDTVIQSIIKPVSEIAQKGDIHDSETIIQPLARGLDRAMFTYAPGAGVIKFLGDTLPTYITGSRPEGSTETERVLETGRSLIK